ncbi:hypothetical protein MFIFM68171_07354 [Madurella fahalii]|uniref:Uncharacterized protein n=1 Tax=Madurella fahalii TaxID=1157608 RepID=A0ABQ0GHJ1_9PEZI
MTTIFYTPGSQPPILFSAPIRSVLTSLSSAPTPGPGPALDDTAAHIVATVTASADPAHALWELWDAFFIAVATAPSSQSHAPHLALLDALRAQQPTRPHNVPPASEAERALRSYTQPDGTLRWAELPRFSAQWRDVHDILEVWRDWDDGGFRCRYYLRFCDFSAALLGATQGKGEVHSLWVFVACRNVLEREGPEPGQPGPHRIPPKQVWPLDVRVTATWVRGEARALWNTDHEELRQEWAEALDEKTELWPREDGLTRERSVISEATKVVEDILEENRT